MRILTNPGANLSREILDRYGIAITPQRIVVDGQVHDTTEPPPLATIDEWVKRAKVHPTIEVNTQAEFIEAFRKDGQRDPAILAIMNSRKLMGSYDAAVKAAQSIAAPLHVEILDSKTTDQGCGLTAVLAAEALRAGLEIPRVMSMLKSFVDAQCTLLTVETLDNLVKGGRASFLKALFANLLNVTPLITMKEGSLTNIGRIPRGSSVPEAMAGWLFERLGPGRTVWLAISHGGSPARAASLEAALRKRFDVRHVSTRAFQASVYLHVGAGALGAFVCPIDGLGWEPKIT